jgi:hypothetical protein
MLAADDFAMVPRDGLWWAVINGITRIAALARELDIAERAYNHTLPFRGFIPLSGFIGEPIAFSLGTAAAALGRFDDAEQFFAEAIDLSERLGAPSFVAGIRAQWAETLLDPNGPHDVSRAKALAQQALTTSEELGLTRVAELSRRVLSA